MKKLLTIVLAALLVVPTLTSAKEGMWIPFLLGQLNESEMQAMGMKMTAEDIYSVNQSSLKDAIVHFGGFCTGEVISDQGLVLTNHHCGYGAIQSHSSVEHNYLEDGFWAMDRSEEKPNADLFVTFIKEIQDVTVRALYGVEEGMTEAERSKVIQENIDKIIDEEEGNSDYDVMIRAFFKGNQYFMFFTETFNDVRLVGAPPSSIGKYGADTDNWMWPRHTGDFSLFRIYADENNQPAEFSETNVPYRPNHHLPISLGDVNPGDFTMIFGFPGSTDEYVPSAVIGGIIDEINPLGIAFRERSLAAMDQYMRAEKAVKIKYASKYASISNSYKKWIGMVKGLKSSQAIAEKEMYEELFEQRVSSNRRFPASYKTILDSYKAIYDEYLVYRLARQAFIEAAIVNVELLDYARSWNRFLQLAENTENEAKLQVAFESLVSEMDGFYKDFDMRVDRDVYAAVMPYYESRIAMNLRADEIPGDPNDEDASMREVEKLYDKTYLKSIESMRNLTSKGWEKTYKKLKKDPMLALAADMMDSYREEILPMYRTFSTKLDSLDRLYMQAQMNVFSDRTFYPDANSTLRVSYGQVQGFYPRDGVMYNHYTTLDGVIEKYVPGDYEFDLPQRILDLYAEQDYGRYANGAGEMPVCFIASNHTSGGNSGSPAIDANGNLIGLNFDRVWEGTMSDYNFDERLCRNIMVDIRYVLFIVDKFAGAGHLVNEMTLVLPETNIDREAPEEEVMPEEGPVD